MRLCQGLLCEEAATIWFRGPWCAAHALKRFGKRDIILAARFSELHRSLEASRVDPSPPLVREEGIDRPLSVASRPREGASVVGSLAASEPSPISDEELSDLLETEGMGEWEGW